MTTMKDLRQEVQRRLHETLDGREIDMMENNVTTPHMLGIVPIGVRSNRDVEEGTLLDPEHEVWSDFEEDVRTKNGASRQIESAIRSLKKDDLFQMTYPYGEEAEVVYCEVEPVEERQLQLTYTLESSCPKCETELYTSPLLDLTTSSAQIKVSVECEECGFSANYETSMLRK